MDYLALISGYDPVTISKTKFFKITILQAGEISQWLQSLDGRKHGSGFQHPHARHRHYTHIYHINTSRPNIHRILFSKDKQCSNAMSQWDNTWKTLRCMSTWIALEDFMPNEEILHNSTKMRSPK